jgi:hypothetical protein
MYIISTAMTTCLSAKLFELVTKVHVLLRPLAENRHLWRVLVKNFENGAMAWTVLATHRFTLLGGCYYLVQFQDGDRYVYREAQLVNLWAFNEKMKTRAKLVAGGREVQVENEGEGLTSAKMDPKKYYVHVKSVRPYFETAERKHRMTVFELNHNVDRFCFELPQFRGGDEMQFIWLTRVVVHLQNPMPYIVSRVRIPPENIQRSDFSPIERACQIVQDQVDGINTAVALEDFNALRPLLQGSIMPAVNVGPKKMAEVFLNGGTENQHTMMLRKLFREFIKAADRGVTAHQKSCVDPAWNQLQEALIGYMSQLKAALMPYLK